MTTPEERPRRRAAWIVLAVLTAIVVVLPTGVATLGRLIERTAAASETTREPITTVEVDGGDAAVTIGATGAATASGRATVQSSLTWAVTKPRVVQSVQSGRLRIMVSCDDGTIVGLDCRADLDVQVPAAVSVRLQSTSGKIAVRGVTGDVRVQGTAGEVLLDGLGGRVWADTNSGAIEGRGLSSAEVDAGVRSGQVDLAFVEQPTTVNVRTGSGDARVVVPRGTHYRVSGNTGSGNREVGDFLVDPAAPNEINVTTGSGSVQVVYPGQS